MEPFRPPEPAAAPATAEAAPTAAERNAAAVERFPCPTCAAPAGSACRTASGHTAHRYHTGRFILVPELQGLDEVRVPASRGPGTPWTGPAGPAAPAASPGSASAASTSRAPAALQRIGYASCAPQEADLPEQIRALESASCARIYFEQADALFRARPERDLALDAACAAAASHPAGALLTVPELRRLARTAQELTAVAERLAVGGVGLELLAGPLAGIHRQHDAGPGLFAVLAATGELDRAHATARIRAGQRAAESGGRRSGRPRVFDDALLAEAVRLRDAGVPVPEIAELLVIPGGSRSGRHPSVASVYRALGEAASSQAAAQREGSRRPA